jgi:hypothetical protein
MRRASVRSDLRTGETVVSLGMKYLCLLLLSLPIALQAQTLGFRGLNLGMTQTQVNVLVRDTEWKYDDYREGKAPDDPDYDENGSDGYGIVLVNSATLACFDVEGQNECYEPSSIRAKYFDHRLYEISILGTEYIVANKHHLSNYYAGIVGVITEKYGQPAKVYATDEDVYRESFIDSISAYGVRELAVWEWSRKVKGKKAKQPVYRVTIKVTTDGVSGDARGVRIIAYMEDLVAIAAKEAAAQ